MTFKRNIWLLVIFFIFVTQLNFSAPEVIHECREINSPGEYILANDIITENQTSCISIISSDVILDGNGHWINGTYSFDSKGIYIDGFSANVSNVTLKNVKVANWYYGIYLSYSSHNTLTNNTANLNNNTGIYLLFSSNNTLTNNTANSNRYGIYLYFSSNNTLINNNASSNSDVGIDLDHSSNNILTNNTANSNGYLGIHIYFSSNNNLTSNTANSNEEGIHLDHSSNNILINNTMNDNTYNFGICGAGISYYYQDIDTSNTVDGKPIYYWTNEKNAPNNCKDTEIDESTNAGFVALVSCDNITVKNLNLSKNYYGILLVNTTDSKILNNNVNSNYEGIHLYSFSNNNILTNNNASSNSGVGIYLDSSSDNTLTNNNVNSNYDGIHLFFSSNNNILTNNNASSNIDCGIYLDFSSNNNILTDNTINSNTQYGILLSSSSNNSIYNNFFNNTNNFYFAGTPSNNWNTTKTPGINIIGRLYLGGNFWAKPDGTGFSETCNDNDYDGICDSSYDLATDNIDYLPLTFSPICYCDSCATCNSKLSDPSCTIVKLTANISDNSGTCISNPENFSNKVFDCQGYTIDGSGLGYGIYLNNKQDNTIENCMITGFEYGIYIFNNSNFNEILNNKISDNNEAGIVISNCVGSGECGNGNINNTIEDNEILNNKIGIFSNSSNSTINRNVVCGNTDYDFYSEDWLSSSGTNNTCSNPDGWNDDGTIGCTKTCDETPITCVCNSCESCRIALNNSNCKEVNLSVDLIVPAGGTCIHNYEGFSDKIFNCQGHSIRGNSQDGFGFYITNSQNFEIKNCLISDFDYGIYLQDVVNATIENNVIELVDGAAIYLLSSSYNKIKNNTFNNNSYYGISLSYSSNNILENNNGDSNGMGFVMGASSNNTFVNNTISNSGGTGFYIISSEYNVLRNNLIFSNNWGIYLRESSNNILINNVISSNIQEGIDIHASSNNLIQNNFFNNTVNVNITESLPNLWNITKTPGTNIIEGSYLGGNFWATPNGTGFSENISACNPGDDGICENPYIIDSNNIDYLPLTTYTSSEGSPIDQCTTIDTPGVYYLTKDLNQTFDCITITTSNVILNGKGHLISGGGVFPGGTGIYVFNSAQTLANITIKNINVDGWNNGIYLLYSENIVLSNILATNNDYAGIFLFGNSKGHIYNVTAKNNKIHGIILEGNNSEIEMKDNKMYNNTFNIYVSVGGDPQPDYLHSLDIDSSNLVEGKPVFYWVNKTDAEISELDDPGFIALISCQNITIKNVNISKNTDGILLYNTTNSKIINASVSSNYGGVHLYRSYNNTILDLKTGYNTYGLVLWQASNNTIQDMTAIYNGRGSRFDSSSNNTILDSKAENNEIGVNLLDSHDNIFINMTVEKSAFIGIYVTVYSSNNTFENSILSRNFYAISFFDSGDNNRFKNTLFCFNKHVLFNDYLGNNTIENSTASCSSSASSYSTNVTYSPLGPGVSSVGSSSYASSSSKQDIIKKESMNSTGDGGTLKDNKVIEKKNVNTLLKITNQEKKTNDSSETSNNISRQPEVSLGQATSSIIFYTIIVFSIAATGILILLYLKVI